MKTISTLAELAEIAQSCEQCQLSCTRTNVVFGEGNPNADVLFIGEGPGKNEDLQGRPFVGAAGKVLDELLASINFKREDVYIANVVKCRPPQNRDPLPDEVQACWKYLKRQVELIKPKLIILLGRHAMYRFLTSDLKISQAHGQAFNYKAIDDPTAKQTYMPVFHPAVALYTPSKKEVLLADFAKIPKTLELISHRHERLASTA